MHCKAFISLKKHYGECIHYEQTLNKNEWCRSPVALWDVGSLIYILQCVYSYIALWNSDLTEWIESWENFDKNNVLKKEVDMWNLEKWYRWSYSQSWNRDTDIERKYIFPGGSHGKASAYHVGDPGSIPGSGRSPGEGNGNPPQYSCLENPMDSETW